MARRLFQGERILLVEDNGRLLRSMAFLLKVVGFEVLTADDGEAALEVLGKRVPDLIISDIDVPQLNGYVLLRLVRGDQRWSSIPFIFTSDKYSLDDLLLALDLGADDYLPKPFDLNDLLEVITRTLPMNVQKERNIV